MKSITPGGDDVVVLDTPEKCREFIKSIRIGKQEAKIEFLQQADGTEIPVDMASDKQVIQVATELASALNKAGAH